MKKHILFISILFLSVSSYACEICGCSNSNFQIGLLPNFSKGFLGYRFSYSHFNSQLKSDPSQFSHDYYKTMELWGGYNIKRFQVMAFMPYIFSRKESDDGITTSNGIGDLMMLVNYRLLRSASLSNEKSTVMHDLFVGGGIKLPTGLNQVNPSGLNFNIGDFNSQAGTGSFDYILNLTHNLMWNNNGVVTNMAYRINTANDQGYRFGNRVYVNTAYYHTFTKSGVKIKPNVGINFQSNDANAFREDKVAESSGFNFNSTLGVNILKGKMGFNAMGFIPVSQNNFDGQTKLVFQLLAGMTYSF